LNATDPFLARRFPFLVAAATEDRFEDFSDNLLVWQVFHTGPKAAKSWQEGRNF
jgi:hypothetical protein